jgi:hypothetical protein
VRAPERGVNFLEVDVAICSIDHRSESGVEGNRLHGEIELEVRGRRRALDLDVLEHAIERTL